MSLDRLGDRREVVEVVLRPLHDPDPFPLGIALAEVTYLGQKEYVDAQPLFVDPFVSAHVVTSQGERFPYLEVHLWGSPRQHQPAQSRGKESVCGIDFASPVVRAAHEHQSVFGAQRTRLHGHAVENRQQPDEKHSQ